MPEMLKLSQSTVACLLVTACGAVTTSPPATARVRVAHVSPGAPAVDFCLARHGTTQFTGPILAGAGRAAGLSYSTVTRYFDVDAARYDVRLVAPGAASCAQPLAGLDDFTRLPELTPGASATIAAEGTLGGQGDAAFTLRGYADDAEAPPGQASLRFVHASPGTPPVDAGTGGGALFAPVFSDVAFGGDATVTTAPLVDALISARAHGTAADVIAADHTSLPAGTVATAFAIGQLGGAAPLRVLLCLDNAEPNGVHAACSVVGDAPSLAHLRIAHLSPDTPAVDVCLAPAGSHAFDRPLLRTLGAPGLSYPQVTTYVDLPAASYDVRVVHASAASCATPVIPDTTLAPPAGDTATVAAIGDLEPIGPDPALQLAVLIDNTEVAAAMTKLRFVHASPGTPAVDVGTGTGVGFQRLFAGVAFGKVAVHPPLEDGYLQTSPLAATTLTARLAGSATDALSIAHISFDPGAIATVFAIGGKTGQTVNPLRLLVCRDSHSADGLLASCAIAP
ncbi:MAG TPA: DUF4397 domain-containing protein [Kofleriaceae bacterium]|jgi:hypothetical protein|nr:DUF4397 domain-containing protein [Kofleriaceae bacterium]